VEALVAEANPAGLVGTVIIHSKEVTIIYRHHTTYATDVTKEGTTRIVVPRTGIPTTTRSNKQALLSKIRLPFGNFVQKSS